MKILSALKNFLSKKDKVGSSEISLVQKDGSLNRFQWKIILSNSSLIASMPEDFKPLFAKRVKSFLDQVAFTSHGEIDITDEMKILTAAHAALLMLKDDSFVRNLKMMSFYNDQFKVDDQLVKSIFEMTSRNISLSWNHVQLDIKKDINTNKGLGSHIILYELAHLLDFSNGLAINNLPKLSKEQNKKEWNQILDKASQRHIDYLENSDKKSDESLDFDMKKPGEFFARSVEMFFMGSKRLKREEADLYAQLSQIFDLDPAEWS